MIHLPTPATPDQAHAYICEHDAAVRRWSKQSKQTLQSEYRYIDPVTFVVGGPAAWSRDELVNRLADITFPDTAAARVIYYADHYAIKAG